MRKFLRWAAIAYIVADASRAALRASFRELRREPPHSLNRLGVVAQWLVGGYRPEEGE